MFLFLKTNNTAVKKELIMRIARLTCNMGGGGLLNRTRQGFTLGELTITLIVISLAVIVTLPITYSKMKKVDYVSYYTGYEAVKNISINMLPGLIEEPEIPDNPDVGVDPVVPEEPEKSKCVFKFSDGSCLHAANYDVRLLDYEECLKIKDSLGMHSCYNYYDRWGGIVKTCGGIDKLPTKDQITEIAKYVYHTSNINSTGEHFGLTLDLDRMRELGFRPYTGEGSLGPICSATQVSGTNSVLCRFFRTNYTDWDAVGRGYPGTPALCVGEDDTEDSEDSGSSGSSGGSSGSDNPVIPDDPDEPEVTEDKDYTPLLCKRLEEGFNIDASDCSVTTETVSQAAADGVFKETTPQLVLSNGLKLYLGSDYGVVDELSDAEDADDRKGFIIYVDINGNSGNGVLWEDVFPFYLLKSGKVIAAYNSDVPAGGNNGDNLKVNVVYDSFKNGRREIKLLIRDTNFKNAACAAGYIRSEKYCDNRAQYDLCKKQYHDCRMIIKQPLKIF